MKEKELEKELNRIQKLIKRRKIIEKAVYITDEYGELKSQEYSCYTKYQSKFSQKDGEGRGLEINHTGGWTMFGGEDIKITYDKNTVFYASTISENRSTSDEKVFVIDMGELYIHHYTPGNWEKQLRLIYRYGPKKDKPAVVKPEEREVDKSKLEELAARLPIKLK